jgi:formylglycine-generating enzyme required for sulfatase activity
MRRIPPLVVLVAAVCVVPVLAAAKCGPDSVEVGPTCVDKYEASIWQIPAGATTLIKRVKKGTATAAELIAGGASLRGGAEGAECTDLEYPATFPSNGHWTEPLYAASLPDVRPSACLSWYQAEQACALAGKRLITNQEWQRAVAGTPDSSADNGVTDCNSGSVFAAIPTGARAGCVSRWGVYDMIGNLAEMTGDWDERAESCSFQSLNLGGDSLCVGGPGNGELGTVIRGGFWDFGIPNGGAFFLSAALTPESRWGHIGFRCAR